MTASLTLPSEPTGYGPDTAPPAPAWLIEATPGAEPLVKALNDATEAARANSVSRREATRAFREASRTDVDNNWVPLPSVEYDRWRQLKSTMGDAEAVERTLSRAVKRAWLALRDHVAQSDKAEEAAEAKAHELLEEATEAAAAFHEAARACVAAEKLVPSFFFRSEGGAFGYGLGTALAKLGSEAEALVSPVKPWTTTYRGAAE